MGAFRRDHHALRVILRDAVLIRRIVHRALLRSDRALTGDTTLQLSADFLAGALFDRVSTTKKSQRTEEEKKRGGFHLCMLGKGTANASAAKRRAGRAAMITM